MIKLFRFLGSVYFAILLILLAACYAIMGTFIESGTSSHQYAARLTYNNPAFNLLLCGFFCNIFISTCRRWPFRLRHIPFIMTHLGLLMILGGVLMKNYFGRQGSMQIMEGTGQDEIYIAHRPALLLEKRNAFRSLPEKSVIPLPLPSTAAKDLSIETVSYYPHSKEIIETWIKGDCGVLFGLPPFPLNTPIQARLTAPVPWTFVALQSENPLSAFQNIYEDTFNLRLIDAKTERLLYEKNLKDAMQAPLILPQGEANVSLKLPFSSQEGFSDPCIDIHITPQEGTKTQHYTLPLAGPLRGQMIGQASPFFGAPGIRMELHGTPSVFFIENPLHEVYLFAFDSGGRVYAELFKSDTLSRLAVYDRGFSGYSVWADLPFSNETSPTLETLKLQKIKMDLARPLENSYALASPLNLLQGACKVNQIDFIECLLDFLYSWHTSQALLLPDECEGKSSLQKCMESLDWNQLPEDIRKGCYWTAFLLGRLQEMLPYEPDLKACLHVMKWPLIAALEADAEPELLHLWVQQIFSVACHLPDPSFKISNGKILSSLFLLHRIHLSYMPPFALEAPSSFRLECPITFKFQSLPSLTQLEDNMPLIQLKFTEREQTEDVYLRFDRSLSGLKTPVLNGRYLVRFQPYSEEIPYRLRLRQARQVNYPDSNQPCSYECDLIVTDKRTGEADETTLSMNHVYETWEGYRFYLSNIFPPDEGSVKRVQIIVNLDPAKYILTYPGCILMVIGIISLLWIKSRP